MATMLASSSTAAMELQVVGAGPTDEAIPVDEELNRIQRLPLVWKDVSHVVQVRIRPRPSFLRVAPPPPRPRLTPVSS